MIRPALTLCYVLAALLGPGGCCCLLRAAVPVAAKKAAHPPRPPATKGTGQGCSHCCPAEEPPPAVPSPSGPAPTNEPGCPCQDASAAAPAVAVPPVVAADSLDDPAGSAPWVSTAVETATGHAAMVDARGGPPDPFPSAHVLIRVFHLMRC